MPAELDETYIAVADNFFARERRDEAAWPTVDEVNAHQVEITVSLLMVKVVQLIAASHFIHGVR